MSNKTPNYNLTKPTADDFYDVDVPNGNMDIIDAELKKLDDEKAPNGHGLGESGNIAGSIPLKEVMHRGCGFYQVGHPDDSPLPTGEWMGLIQMVRNPNENTENGTQLAFYDFSTSNPRMWMRNLINGSASSWVEMIHTGNAVSLLPFLKIANGSYVGTGSKTITLTFDFQPKILFFNGCFAIPYGTTLAYVDRSNITVGIKITWNGNSVTIGDGGSDMGFPWHQKDTTYYYAAIG